MNAGKVILSIVAGAAAGAALGLLYAPDKGENTRRMIAQKGEDLRGNLKDKFSQTKDKFSQTVERTKGRVHEAMDKGSSKFHDVTSDVNPEII